MTLLLTHLQNWMAAHVAALHDEEKGLTTTEVAVVMFLLVGAATFVMGIISVATTDNAGSIPVPEAPAPQSLTVVAMAATPTSAGAWRCCARRSGPAGPCSPHMARLLNYWPR